MMFYSLLLRCAFSFCFCSDVAEQVAGASFHPFNSVQREWVSKRLILRALYIRLILLKREYHWQKGKLFL